MLMSRSPAGLIWTFDLQMVSYGEMSDGEGAGATSREEKAFRIPLTHRDALIIRMRFKRVDGKKMVSEFALTYHAEIDESWYEVIRYDTAHGYLEVHKLWRSPEGIRLPDEGIPYDDLLVKYRNDIRDHYVRYRELMARKLREGSSGEEEST